MKKILTLFTLALLCTLLTCTALAAQQVVFLKDGGSGNGTSADRAIGSLNNAVSALDLDEDCTIVICGPFTQTGTFIRPETFDGKITLTSVYDGVDYRKTDGAVYNVSGAFRFVLTGEWCFERMDFGITSCLFVIANHHPVTIGEDVNMTALSDKFDGTSFGTSFAILGGYQSGQVLQSGSEEKPAAENDLPTNITVKSGRNLNIAAFSRMMDGASYMGKATVNIGGDANVTKLYLTPVNKPFSCGDTVVNLDGDAVVEEMIGATSSGFAESITVNWQGGEIHKFNRVSGKADLSVTNGILLNYATAVAAQKNFAAVSAVFDRALSTDAPAKVEKSEGGAARALFALGLAKGYDSTGTNFGLPDPLTRIQTVVQVIRFLGKEAEVLSGKYNHPFVDVPSWADNYVGYAYETKITSGRDATHFDPDGRVDEIQFLTFMLRAVGYSDAAGEFTWNAPHALAKQIGMTARDSAAPTFDRGSAFKIAWDTLFATAKGGGTVADKLIGQGVFTSTQFEAAKALPEDSSSGVPSGTSLRVGALHTIDMLNMATVSPDSHKDAYKRSSLELNYRTYTELDESVLQTGGVTYPRIKKMQNGEFILFYQNATIGSNIYYALSKDGMTFSKGTLLYKLHAADGLGGAADSIRYSTCDALVLKNGDILAVASYRYNSGYAKDASMGGLVLRRSSDNGKTFGDEQVIYTGINWEPFLCQTADGKVEIYFTHNAPKFYIDGKVDETYLSSGVGRIVSADNGYTWTPNVTGAPYSADVVMQQKRGEIGGKTLFTDQMPAALHLHSGKSAIAVESRLLSDNETLYISLGYSDDGFAKTLGIEEVGPADRANNIFPGAAPYLLQFPSGETLLSYNNNNRFYLRLGSADATDFGAAYAPFLRGGFWGTAERTGSHSAIVSVANSANDKKVLMLGQVILNHEISADRFAVTVDGDNAEWAQHTDALFIGSESQAQVALRAAQDAEKIYLLAERADNTLTDGDSLTLFLTTAESAAAGNKTYYRIKLTAGGVTELMRADDENIEKLDPGALTCAVSLHGTVGENGDVDAGSITELALPKSLIGDGDLLLTATLYNRDNGTSTLSDGFSGTATANPDTWLPIKVK
ncbi:MAG: S-layer homology domain-containing protein [Clostridia bacterium]|nr:S-layer homology domain-containing protein [Clostridia bacterium]